MVWRRRWVMGEPLLVAGGYCNEVRVLHAHRGDVRRTIVLQDSHVNRLVATPDHRRLAIATKHHVRLYDLAAGAPDATGVQTCTGHSANVTSLGVDADGRWFYTGSEDCLAKVWDLRARNCQLYFENTCAVHTMDLHPSQVELFVGDHKGRLQIWDLAANRIRQCLICEEDVPVRSIAVAPDASVAVCAYHHGACYVWRLHDEAPEPLQKIDAHGTYVLKCLFSPEAKLLATASADRTTYLWRFHADCFARTNTLEGHRRWVWDCAFSRDGLYLATGSSDCTCRIWDTRSGVQRLEFGGFKKGVTAIALLDASEGGAA